MTFGDTVALAQAHAPLTSSGQLSLLFHELVHVVQYSVLGIDRFAELYVTGWASAGFVYERIPLELHAYSLEALFQSASSPFQVEREVMQLLREAA